jgi:Helix-turn-helix domain
MLAFDSASVPIRDRQDAIDGSITSEAAATFMTPEQGAENLHLRMHAWDLGGVEVVDARCSAHTMRRSSRQLYKACPRADLHLEQWIISQRLERAREDLARPSPKPLPINQFAHRWGFAGASHFPRRFRGAYGTSPREWQALNRQ